jgi:hypothetical protein
LLGSIEQSTKRISIAVQLRPDAKDEKKAEDEVDRMQDYLEHYFDWTLNLQVYWGPAADFARELQQRLGGEVERDATNPAAR